MREPIKVEVITPRETVLERISAYVPIFISILALSLAIDSAVEARRHNKLSVKPSIHFNKESATTAAKVGLTFENNGLGPAVISNFSIFLDNQKMEKDGFPDWDGVSDKLLGMFTPRSPEWFWCSDGYVVKVGQSIALYTTQPENVRDLDGFRRLISQRLIVRVHVCSLYQECDDVCSGDRPHSECLALK